MSQPPCGHTHIRPAAPTPGSASWVPPSPSSTVISEALEVGVWYISAIYPPTVSGWRAVLVTLSPWSWTVHCLHQRFLSRVCFCFLCKSSWRSRRSLPTSEALNVSMHPCFALVCKESVWLNSGLEIVFSQFFLKTLISEPELFRTYFCSLILYVWLGFGLLCPRNWDPNPSSFWCSGILWQRTHLVRVQFECVLTPFVSWTLMFFNSVKTSWNF